MASGCANPDPRASTIISRAWPPRFIEAFMTFRTVALVAPSASDLNSTGCPSTQASAERSPGIRLSGIAWTALPSAASTTAMRRSRAVNGRKDSSIVPASRLTGPLLPTGEPAVSEGSTQQVMLSKEPRTNHMAMQRVWKQHSPGPHDLCSTPEFQPYGNVSCILRLGHFTKLATREASKVHLNRRLFPLLKLCDPCLEVLQLMLHALMRIEVIPVTPVLTSVAQRVEREHIVNVPPGTFDPDGELGVDDVMPVLQSAKELAVVFVVPIDFVFRQNTGDIGPLFRPHWHQRGGKVAQHLHKIPTAERAPPKAHDVVTQSRIKHGDHQVEQEKLHHPVVQLHQPPVHLDHHLQRCQFVINAREFAGRVVGIDARLLQGDVKGVEAHVVDQAGIG